MESRVLVIGLDGATLDLIEPWVEAGNLPVMAKLMKEGAYSRLRSVQPVISAGAWVTFMTGVNQGKHGVYDFIYRDPTSYSLLPVTYKNLHAPVLWKVLSEQHKKVGVINVPMTYPPEEVNGFIVTGLGTPSYSTFTYPPELGKELLKNGYQINRRIYQHHDNEEAFLEDTYRITRELTKATIRLMTKEPWDFLMVVYRDTDEIAHGFWHHMDSSHPEHDPSAKVEFKNAILNYYKTVDSAIGELLNEVGDDTTVIVMSDHGFGPLYKDVYLNEWLRQHGYLKLKKPPLYRHMFSQLGLTRNNISRTLRYLRLGKIEQILKDKLGENISILPQTEFADFSEGIDWEHTKAYSFGYQGQIFVNQTGREPNGIISSGSEKEKLLMNLKKELREWTNPMDGLPVVDEILNQSDLYHGAKVVSAPDIVLVMRNLSYITRKGFELSNGYGEIFGNSKLRESGGHRLNGTLIAYGPCIQKANSELPPAWIGDLMPTIIHVLGCAIPNIVDGKVLSEWLVPKIANKPIDNYEWSGDKKKNLDKVLSDTEKEDILERLKNLGYLD